MAPPAISSGAGFMSARFIPDRLGEKAPAIRCAMVAVAFPTVDAPVRHPCTSSESESARTSEMHQP